MMSLRLLLFAGMVVLALVTAAKVKQWSQRRKCRAKIVRAQRACEEDGSPTIFVSIASYRDPDLPRTILDCLENATKPFRVHIGVCIQNQDGDPDPMETYARLAKQVGSYDFSDQIKPLRVPAREALGPMNARARIEKALYRGENYYMIVDSHTRFRKAWDVECIEQLHRCAHISPDPILTTVPPDFSADDNRGVLPSAWPLAAATPSSSGPTAAATATATAPEDADAVENVQYPRCRGFSKAAGTAKIEGVHTVSPPLRPHPSLVWSPGFSFASAAMLKRCPYDPHYRYSFHGEDNLMSMRLYTHGFNFFVPSKTIVRHRWSRKGRHGLYWEQWHGDKSKMRDEEWALVRMKQVIFGIQLQGATPQLMAAANDGERYGVGAKRTRQEYSQFTGIDPLRRTVQPHTVLGVQQSPPHDEIVCKFGTRRAMDRALEEVKAQL
jgi:UDP-GlcNAc:polypeptide alpha-N-acetylglucosaminyltransferase